MKIGFVLECTLDGPEMKICRWLAKQICPKFDGGNVEFRPMNNKQFLMEACGDVARNLLDSGCQHVFILWDLAPAWPNGEQPDCVREVSVVKAELKKAKVPQPKATCVCITHEIETWLLADTEALREFCSTDAHKKERVRSKGRLERIVDPKDELKRILRNRGKTYNGHYDALPIIQKADPKKLRKVQSYARLEDKLRALC